MAEPTTPSDVGQKQREAQARARIDYARVQLDEAAWLLNLDPEPRQKPVKGPDPIAELSAIVHDHLETLPPEERDARRAAFRRVLLDEAARLLDTPPTPTQEEGK